MTNQNTILSSLKESFKLIKNKKKYFSLLFITQLVLLLVISSLLLNYSAKIGEELQNMRDPLESISNTSINITDTYQSFEQLESIQDSYSNIINYILTLVLFSFLAYLVINSINWGISNLMINKDYQLLKYISMFGISTLLFSAAALLIGFFFYKVSKPGSQMFSFTVIALLIIATYLAYVSFGLIRKYKPKKIKNFLKHTLKLAYKKPETLVFSYIIIVLTTLFFAAIVYKLLYAPMPALILSLILLILAINWGRIFFLTAARNADKKINNN